ncbi:hypothetical protein [Pseudomonas matsuisoli]|nr:hypothetical protein [Pseudomonas matsuisoli]
MFFDKDNAVDAERFLVFGGAIVGLSSLAVVVGAVFSVYQLLN